MKTNAEVSTLCDFCSGVPKAHRGDIWWLLTEQHKLQYPGVENQTPTKPYNELLKDLTEYQHNILIDLGSCKTRTSKK